MMDLYTACKHYKNHPDIASKLEIAADAINEDIGEILPRFVESAREEAKKGRND